eukprot:gnl/MRDRNA2_/MRDRNA2_89474_c0_seq1.p1 gnl/MRDRNA2_/MRDRNA2_89474_c0~~gnl/MRDRNA2_/MRDRNA2_89474_c0_seq1.p1  ORF type:complete len:176 (+),score=28.17 gnl/MRDRNA2_/MRDRNA2_89474_c0_seq1:102-629(+)
MMSFALRATCLIYIAMLLISMSAAVRMPSTKAARNQHQEHVVRRERNYGLVGNMIAAWYQRAHVSKNSTSVERRSGPPNITSVSPVKMYDATLPQLKVSKSPLKGMKELVRILWTNFLPDPTFNNAVKSLKQHDMQLSVDAPPEQDGHVAAMRYKISSQRSAYLYSHQRAGGMMG